MPDIGYGVQLRVSDAFPATSPTNLIGQVMSVTPPSPTRDIIDVTSSSSPNMAREFITGLIDYGEATCEMNWEPGSAADTLLRGISLERSPRTYQLRWTQTTPDVAITFTGYLTAYERSSPMGEKMTATVTIKVTGEPVQTTI
jgi:hypothetical protein